VMKARTIVREGKDYYEFNLVVSSYPKRHKLEDRGLPNATLDSLLHTSTGVGIYVELRGYGSRGKTNIKLLSIPYVKLYVQRPSDGYFLNGGIKFNKNMPDDKLMIDLAQQFYASKGDAAAYAEILMKY